MRRIVTLLSDFGTRDHYVAAMKGVLLAINPALILVDISHEVTPHNVREAGFLLAAAFNVFPAGTIHLAVVDPGVGSERRALAAAGARHLFVGPDNGLFDRAFALEPPRFVVSLENPDYRRPQVSPTFHGRDIFAPAAGHLSLGVPLEKLGPVISNRIQTAPPPRLGKQDRVEGEIIHVDRFGNLIADIEIPPDERLKSDLEVWVGGRQVLVGPRTYNEAPPGVPFAMRGSSGYLEVAVREGSALEALGQGVGTLVRVQRQNR
jgi:S-adenosyl-L-methionine hydrolase (adenosine-forming)